MKKPTIVKSSDGRLMFDRQYFVSLEMDKYKPLLEPNPKYQIVVHLLVPGTVMGAKDYKSISVSYKNQRAAKRVLKEVGDQLK